jgi:acyl carrier protein
MTDATFAKLQQTFRQVFNAPALELREDMTAADVRGWDSLKHVELMVAVEAAFGVRFKTAEVANMENVGALIGKLRQKLAR